MPWFAERPGRFAVYAQNSKDLVALSANESRPVTLCRLTWELFTIVPIEAGICTHRPTQDAQQFGAVLEAGVDVDGSYRIVLKPNGTFLLWAQAKPKKVTVDGKDTTFQYDEAKHALTVDIAFRPSPVVVRSY